MSFLGGLFGGGSSSSSSSTSTTTSYTDNSSDFQNAASLGMGATNNKVIGAGATYTYTEGGLTGDNLKNLTSTVKTLNSDSLNATKSLATKAFDAANNLYDTTLKLYNKSENTLSQVFDKTVSSVQSSASKAMETTAQAYAESDDEFRRAIDGLRPIAMYVMFAAITYFIFKNKRW